MNSRDKYKLFELMIFILSIQFSIYVLLSGRYYVAFIKIMLIRILFFNLKQWFYVQRLYTLKRSINVDLSEEESRKKKWLPESTLF